MIESNRADDHAGAGLFKGEEKEELKTTLRSLSHPAQVQPCAQDPAAAYILCSIHVDNEWLADQRQLSLSAYLSLSFSLSRLYQSLDRSIAFIKHNPLPSVS